MKQHIKYMDKCFNFCDVKIVMRCSQAKVMTLYDIVLICVQSPFLTALVLRGAAEIRTEERTRSKDPS